MAKLLYKQRSDSKKQVSAFLHSKKASNKWLISELQIVKRRTIKRLKMSIALNITLILYVIIRGIYG